MPLSGWIVDSLVGTYRARGAVLVDIQCSLSTLIRETTFPKTTNGLMCQKGKCSSHDVHSHAGMDAHLSHWFQTCTHGHDVYICEHQARQAFVCGHIYQYHWLCVKPFMRQQSCMDISYQRGRNFKLPGGRGLESPAQHRTWNFKVLRAHMHISLCVHV